MLDRVEVARLAAEGRIRLSHHAVQRIRERVAGAFRWQCGEITDKVRAFLCAADSVEACGKEARVFRNGATLVVSLDNDGSRRLVVVTVFKRGRETISARAFR